MVKSDIYSTRIVKAVLTREGSNLFMNVIHNVTTHGFRFQRTPVTVSGTTLNFDYINSVTLDHNEWQYALDTPTKDYHLCVSTASFLLIINRQRIFTSKWNMGFSKFPYLHHNTWMNSHNILYSNCYSDSTATPLLLLIANVAGGTNFMIFKTNDVNDHLNFLVLNQTLPETVLDSATLDNPITVIDRSTFNIRVTKKTYTFKLNIIDWTLQAKDSATTPSSESFFYNLLSWAFDGSKSTKSQNLSYTTVAEFNTFDVSNPNKMLYNLTSNSTCVSNQTNPNITKVWIDEAFNYQGHVWELKLSKPPYVLKNVDLNSRIRKADVLKNMIYAETLSANYLAPQATSYTKFSSLGNITLVMQNLAEESVYLEAKPPKIMASDYQMKWNATLFNRNCYEVSIIKENYPSFTAVLKCRDISITDENRYYLFGIEGTLVQNASTVSYNHFQINYSSKSDDEGPMEAVAGGADGQLVFLLYFNQNSSAVMYAADYPTPTSNLTTTPPLGSIKSFSNSLTSVNFCNLVKCKSSRGCYVSVCSNIQTGTTNFLRMSSVYVPEATLFPSSLSMSPLNQYCNTNNQVSKNWIRCVYSTNSELIMIDYEEETNFTRANPPAGVSNPRTYVLLQDYIPSTITFTNNFIGYIGKQNSYNLGDPTISTPVPPNWVFAVYHINSDGLYNFTNQTNQIYSYAALALPRATAQPNPFHEAKIFPYMETVSWMETCNDTNKTYTMQDNYFLFQEAIGDIYVHKIESYVLTVLNNHTKIKTFLEEASFTTDQNNMNTPIPTSTLFSNLRLQSKASVSVGSANNAQSTSTAAKSLIIALIAISAAVVGLAAYLMLRKKEKGTTSLAIQMRHESGVLRL